MILRLIALSLSLLVTQVVYAQGVAVTGVVAERVSRQPIPGAIVGIDGTGQRATTNALGRFRIEGVAAGRIQLSIEAPGYLKLQVPDVQVQAGKSTDLVIDLDITPNILERVQVTATKEPLNVGTVAGQTDVVSRSTIDDRGDQTLVQALNHIPGAVVSTQLGVFESFMLRGMPRGDPEFTNVLVLVDGVPQTLANNAARVVALPINDTETIEVFRGPNSALYGRSAIGGAVNIRTPSPWTKHHGSFEFTGGEFEMVKGLGSATGPIHNWGGYYVSAGAERNHGFWKSRTGDGNIGNSSQFGKLTFVPDKRSFGSFTYNHVLSDNSTPTNEPIINGQLLHEQEPLFDRLTSFNIPGPNYHQEENRLTLSYNRQLTSWVNVGATGAYRRVQHKFINDGDFIGSPFDTENHTVTMYPFNQQLDEDVFFHESRLEFHPRLGNLKSSGIAGYSYEWNGGNIDADFIFTDENTLGIPIDYLNPEIPATTSWQHNFAPHRSYHQGIHGLFGSYTIEPFSRLVLTGGGRYDRMALDHTKGTDPTIRKKIDAFSPKGSATLRVLGVGTDRSTTLNLYAAYSQSFVPPRRPSALNDLDPPLNPEEIHNYETGFKGSILNGRVALEGTYFWMSEDGVVLNRRDGPNIVPTNAGRILYKGVETGFDVAVTKKISAYGNASFYHNRFGNFVIEDVAGDTVLTGNRLPISPDQVFNAGATYRPIRSVNANVNVKYVGPVQTTNENTFELRHYTVADAAISWRRDPMRITVSAHNLLNEKYYWTGGETADPGPTRQVLVSVQFSTK
jgi:iron complex outermembrane receptor protein